MLKANDELDGKRLATVLALKVLSGRKEHECRHIFVVSNICTQARPVGSSKGNVLPHTQKKGHKMSARETQELEAAAQKLSLDVLKKSLEVNGGDSGGKKEEVLHRIGNKVLEIGLEGFLEGLGKESVKALCDQIKPKEGSGGGARKKETPKIRLFRHILEMGLEYFLQDCTKEQLNNFCSVLLLEQSSTDAMVSQIADEVMLTGTKKFLHNLSVLLLKKWCAQLGLTPASAKKQLVEQLMVHIFELEPLDEEEQEEDEGDRDKKHNKRGSRDEGRGEGVGREREQDKHEQGEAQEKVEGAGDDDVVLKKEQGGGTKREKYVPPPISTIRKGMTKEHLHNTFNATDLKEFCKQNNMTSTGKKPLLIKRIIKFLETGEVEAPKARRGAKRKRPPAEKASSTSKRTKSNERLNTDDNEDEEEEEEDEEDQDEPAAKPLDDSSREVREGMPETQQNDKGTSTVRDTESAKPIGRGTSDGAHENGGAESLAHDFGAPDSMEEAETAKNAPPLVDEAAV